MLDVFYGLCVLFIFFFDVAWCVTVNSHLKSDRWKMTAYLPDYQNVGEEKKTKQ